MERLHMHYLTDLLERVRRGQSDRAIARDLVLSRLTVRKYRELALQHGLADARLPLPDEGTLARLLGPLPPPPRTVSTVAPYAGVVERLVAVGVEAMTIFHRLREDHGYPGSYSSVLRFVHHLQPGERRATVRVHAAAGEEAQVDFGVAGRFVDPRSGRLRPAYVFVMTLSFSRHQYAELVFDQKVATWLGLHRRAFEWFGGVPARVVTDNLKAAVLQAALHDPVLGEAYRRFARHYGFLVSPTRPRTPAHKGKVESGIHYVKRSFLAGQQYADIDQANERLREWVRERAGTRDHGTTHQPPLALFKGQEREHLLPLPAAPFALTETRLVKLHPDCHVVIDGSYYSAPFRYIGRQLEAYVFERVVQLFQGWELIASHPRAERRGSWSTNPAHYPPEKAVYLERTPRYCRELADGIGPATRDVVDQLLEERPQDRLRSVQAILRLTESVGRSRLEAACKRALFFGDPRYRRIKDILNAALDQEPLPEETRPAPPRTSFAFQRSWQDFFEQEARR